MMSMRRFRAQSRWLCLLTAVLMITPGVSLASLVVCHCGSAPATVDEGSAAGSCCALPVEMPGEGNESSDPNTDDSDEPGDEGCDDCDCPAMCCSIVKAQVGVTGVPAWLPAIRTFADYELGMDRDRGVGAVFEIAHPPKS